MNEALQRVHDELIKLYEEKRELESELQHGGTAARSRLEDRLGLRKATKKEKDDGMRQRLAEISEELQAAYAYKQELLSQAMDEKAAERRVECERAKENAWELKRQIDAMEAQLREMRWAWSQETAAVLGYGMKDRPPTIGKEYTFSEGIEELERFVKTEPTAFIRFEEVEKIKAELSKDGHVNPKNETAGDLVVHTRDDGTVSHWERPIYKRHDRVTIEKGKPRLSEREKIERKERMSL